MNRYIKPLVGVFVSSLLWVGAVQATEGTCTLVQVETEMPPVPQGSVSQTPRANAPSVRLDETTYDFGQLKEDGDYVHVFRIKNAGTTVLQIKKVLPG